MSGWLGFDCIPYAPLCALGHLFRNSAEPRNHSLDRLIQVRPQLVALRNPPWIVKAKPGLSGRIPPAPCLQRQIDTDFLVRLHERRARLGIPKISSPVGLKARLTCAAPAA